MVAVGEDGIGRGRKLGILATDAAEDPILSS